MSAEWKEFRLGDITEWASGGTPSKKNANFWNGTIPWISASSMASNRYDDSNLKITPEGLKTGSRLAEKDSILLLVRGSALHKRIPVGIATSDVSFNQDVKAIIAKEDFIEPWYLLFWFMAKEKDLLNMVENTGIGAGKLDTNRLQDMLIKIPSGVERNRICRFAKALDDKILLNRQINQTLESISQAIFKSWFVDFEPVKAKIAALESGKDAEGVTRAAMRAISGKTDADLDKMEGRQPEDYAKLKTTAELFPAAMQDSELGEVPEGWEVKKITDFGSIVCGKTPPKKDDDNYGGDIPFIKIPDMHGNVFVINTSEYLSIIGEKTQMKKQIPKGSVCVSCIATVGLVSIAAKVCHTNQQINSIVPTDIMLTPYLYFSMLERNKLLHDLASGGSATLNLNTGNFAKIELFNPSSESLYEFYKKVNPIFEMLLSNDYQVQQLSQLRDILLPKLLSGELSVDAFELAEAEA